MTFKQVLAFILACFAFLGAALPVQAQSSPSKLGPPRDGMIEGDVPAAALTDREIENLRAFTRVYTVARWFHPSNEALATDWDALAIGAIPRVLAASSSNQLAAALNEIVAPVVTGFSAATGDLPPYEAVASDAPHWRWEHAGFVGAWPTGYSKRRAVLQGFGRGEVFEEALPGSITVRFPLSVPSTDGEAPETVAAQKFDGKPSGWTPAGFDRTTRLAATIIAWGIFDQFYPYWDVVDADWDALLTDQLQRAANAPDDDAFHDALSKLMHELEDGHGIALYSQRASGFAPLLLHYLDEQIVVAWADPATGIAPGSIITSIEGLDARQELTRLMEESHSGSAHWRLRKGLNDLLKGADGSTAAVTYIDPVGIEHRVEISRIRATRDNAPRLPRPEPVSDIDPDVLYVDLTRASDEDLIAAEARLASARAIIFDMRGYPSARLPFYLAHLSDDPVYSAEFLTPVYSKPDQEDVIYNDGSWKYLPALPRLTDNVVFLSDASAVSFPESILGTVKNSGLATIVGAPTAGANGNISPIDLPGGYRLIFTGMKVVNRDGSQHHNIGVVPDVIVAPTRAGLTQGRDEVLEAGLQVVREAMHKS